jgi:hypothetical protein
MDENLALLSLSDLKQRLRDTQRHYDHMAWSAPERREVRTAYENLTELVEAKLQTQT